MNWESEMETNTQLAVKKLCYTSVLLLISILPHRRSWKASLKCFFGPTSLWIL